MIVIYVFFLGIGFAIGLRMGIRGMILTTFGLIMLLFTIACMFVLFLRFDYPQESIYESLGEKIIIASIFLLILYSVTKVVGTWMTRGLFALGIPERVDRMIGGWSGAGLAWLITHLLVSS